MKAAGDGGRAAREIDRLLGFFRKSMVFLPVLVIVAFLVATPSPTAIVRLQSSDSSVEEDLRIDKLMELWEESYNLASRKEKNQSVESPIAAPHLENCFQRRKEFYELDNRDASGKPPVWNSHYDELELSINSSTLESRYFHPPWIEGGDEDNLPMTRRVQRDLWLHQHPKNCSDGSLKFLVTDWLNNRGLGLGAELVAMAGILGIALRERRVLVLKDFERARHEECTGASSGHWSCYFVPETSEECRARALELEGDEKAWREGTIVGLKNFSRLSVWIGPAPEYWGKPWEDMQPFDVIDGKLLAKHKAMDRQWWRSQAVRYLIRFPSEYTCMLLNQARHHAFGRLAAKTIIKSLPENWPEVVISKNYTDMEKLVWVKQKAWIPRPLVSVHVRQGDKAAEMKIFDLKAHMDLAEQVRARFPDTEGIWLSTEMQSVVDEALSNFTSWRFFFTEVTRQNGTTRMGDYERSLGTRQSSNNAFVNLLMAVDCDHFIGALGSTWSFLIDGLRLTGGKLRAGFLSVNKDRYW